MILQTQSEMIRRNDVESTSNCSNVGRLEIYVENEPRNAQNFDFVFD